MKTADQNSNHNQDDTAAVQNRASGNHEASAEETALNDTPNNAQLTVSRRIDANRTGMKMTLRTWRLALVAAAVLAVGIFTTLWLRHSRAPVTPLQTVPVKRGDLVSVIGATGTVEPEEVVDIGAQVAGVIESFGKDADGKPVDYGSPVEEGTVLAHIDDSLYAAAVEQAQANLQSAEANVLQMQAKSVEAGQDWERAQKLGPSEALAPTLYDQYKATYETAKANVVAAQAAVAQAKAALTLAQKNLEYCTIKSPVKGVIVDRRVNIGQTVVSSLSAPSLFLLAKDLNRIQVWVSVNEADIGHIQPGEPVTFTVDAFPGQVFHGTVGKIRLNATMTQNVVTYTVEVNTDNADGKLLPYLTANARFETARRTNVLIVPSVALRWWPDPSEVAPEFRGKAGAGGRATPPGTVWTPQGKFVKPVKVTAGLTDGTMTEVTGRDLTEDLPVIVGEQTLAAANATAAGASPFTPQLGRARTSNGGGGR
jgi:HlyD family secretion protein